MDTAKKKAPAKPAPVRPDFRVGDLRWASTGYQACCGAQIISNFMTAYYDALAQTPDPDNVPKQVLKAYRAQLATYPMTTAITQGRARFGGQYVANKVLPQIGFVPVQEFRGNGGAVLTLWAYVRPGKRIKEA
jgi:hypothetical protein